jgi:hypothetical protein
MAGQQGGKGSGEPDQDAGAPALLRPLRAFAATQVDAQPWAALGFSHDMEHLAAATPAHAVYLYSLVGGALDKVLTLDGACAAHPCCFPRRRKGGGEEEGPHPGRPLFCLGAA